MLRLRKDQSAQSDSFFVDPESNSIDKTQINELKMMSKNNKNVARICLHQNQEEHLHAMVIAQCRGRYWQPKKHLTKPKIFQIMEGVMAVIKFSEDGKVTNKTILSPDSNVLVTVGPGIFHTNIAVSPLVVHNEIILGPYEIGETDRVMANFAPLESQQKSGFEFMDRILNKELL